MVKEKSFYWFVRNFYIQIIIYMIWINNQIATIWSDSTDRYVSWSGSIGYELKYHYWVVFDYNAQILLLWTAVILALAFPLTRDYMVFAVKSSLLAVGIVAIENLRYMYHGNNHLNESLYFIYIGLYTVILMIMAYKSKLLMHGH